MPAKTLYLIADNIRSAQNVGALFRLADGAGVKKIYLTGYTPRPHEFNQKPYPTNAQKLLAKTALGAEKNIPWEYFINSGILIKKLKKELVRIYALEKTEKSLNIFNFKPKFPCALIVGNEISGVDEKILKNCEKVLFIPMRGQKESLNVSVAAGVAAYQILK